MSSRQKLTIAVITVRNCNVEPFGELSLYDVGPDQMYDPVEGVVAEDCPANPLTQQKNSRRIELTTEPAVGRA